LAQPVPLPEQGGSEAVLTCPEAQALDLGGGVSIQRLSL